MKLKLLVKVFLCFIMCLMVAILSHTNYVLGYSTVYLGGTTKKLPIYRVDRSDNSISISFDCAYGNEYTRNLLDILDEYNVKCTFFVTSFWVEKYSDDLKEIHSRGHEIGSHSKTHPNMSKQSVSQIEEELTYSKNVITNITGKEVTLFRPPFGDYDNKVIETCESQNLYAIQWDVDSLDWKDLSKKQITDRVVNKTKSGSIILCHNNGLHTHEALPYILSNLIQKGYKFVPIGELIYKENYKMNSFGEQSLIK